MMRFLSRLLVVVMAFGLCLPCLAQQKSLEQMSASARKLIAITVTGSKRFAEADVAAATGLQMGTTVTEDDFKRAARNLGATGAFTNIEYTYSYSSTGTKLEFHVTDLDKFVPARFEDFVWFSDEELRRRIKEHVPMFDGELPLAGRMADEVSDVLQAMLVEKAIPGHVDYLRVGKEDGPVEAIQYHVSDVLIHIRKFEFSGAGEAELSALKAAADKVPDREYSRARLNVLVQRQLLPIYYARGYLKAALGEPQPKMIKEPGVESDDGARNQSVVDVVFPVTPGRQYTLKSLEWSGNHEFPTDILQKMVHAQIGQPANTIRLSEDLKAVQVLYGSRGFVKATIRPEAQMEDAGGTVSIRLQVDEGAVYHMGELEFRGLDNSLTAKLRGLWKLRSGEVYNASYLSDYLPAAEKLLPSNFDWEVSSHVTANTREKTVDVDLIYSVKATK
jgi:outer membrane protein insertion porin family